VIITNYKIKAKNKYQMANGDKKSKTKVQNDKVIARGGQPDSWSPNHSQANAHSGPNPSCTSPQTARTSGRPDHEGWSQKRNKSYLLTVA